MKFKKLYPELVSGIIDQGLDKEPKQIQSTCIPKIKSGADLLVFAPEGAGKTTTIALGVIQQLKEAFEEAPRAIIMVETKEKAFELEEQIQTLGKHTNLRTFTVFEQGSLLYQKDTIYEGLDIVIGTPRRINELLSNTGIPCSNLKLLMVDDAETIFPNRYHPVVYRVADGSAKIQCLLFANKGHEKFDDLLERIDKNWEVLHFES
ncbi:DEAD/DEAH box helicase [Sunxiuqinia elliptica]|uniref:DEAD/DEAH box helicase n=1 Tax=Sunxiuqinia elliptica TaxID=655355 RepID=A0A1I2GWX3_9BACT|nr:DEAD/DEAH box helicase [Sunxiuqinia elliptica]SFF21106.1 DEAD/DEAH box helicase [Sunxiuqinia elliptica]